MKAAAPKIPEKTADASRGEPAPHPSSDSGHSSSSAAAARRLLIVDDHPLFRHGLSDLINAESDLETCGEADSAPLALDAIRRLTPDLAIVDISLKGTNGIELVKSIKAEHPKLPILVLSMHDESLYAVRALRAGARGYVMKQEAMERVMTAIRDVLKGAVYVSPAMSERLIHEFVETGSGGQSVTERLTDRELEILQLIGEGRGVQEIAQELNLSAKTVETHRAHIKEKFNFKTARELARFAVQWVDQQSV